MKKLNNKEVANEMAVGVAKMCGSACICSKYSDSQANPSDKLQKIYKG